MSTTADRAPSAWFDPIVSRRLGWVVALGALALGATSGARTWAEFHDFGPWWTAASWVFGGLFVVLLAFGLSMPTALLRAVWWLIPPLSAVLTFTSAAAYRGDDLAQMRPWVWSVEPAALALLVFVAPTWIAISGAVVSAAAPLIGSALVTGAVTPGILAYAPFHVGSVALVVILVGLRGRLAVLHESEQQAKAAAVRQARLEADNEKQRALTRIVHDEVLAVFTATLQLRGAAPPPLQAAAARALATLAREDDTSDDDATLTPDAAAAVLRQAAENAAPGCAITTSASGGELPRIAVEAIALAAAEALRNSIRHARSDTPPRVQARIDAQGIFVSVTDDGVGFDPHGVDAMRLGVRESIFGRMEAVPGGSAELTSAPDAGTEVRLAWRR